MVGREKMLHRVLLAAAISWVYSITLGLLFAACASGSLSLNTLRLPGVVPVALLNSTVASILITPIAAWSVRTGMKNIYFYGPILWVVLAVYIVGVIPKTGIYGPYGLFTLSIIGLIILGFIPPAK